MGKNDKIKLAVAIAMLILAGGILYWYVLRDPVPAGESASSVQPSPATPMEQMPPAEPRTTGGGARRAINTPG